MPEVLLLDMDDLRMAHGVLYERFKNEQEPVSAWHEGDRGRLETCCHCVETSAFGQDKYPLLEDKAAKLFYSAIKLHAFPNGNKRFGVMITLLFVLLNGAQIVAEPGELADIATEVAGSDPHQPDTTPDRVIAELAVFFRGRMRPNYLVAPR